jgi:two-component sensor histidine kinase
MAFLRFRRVLVAAILSIPVLVACGCAAPRRAAPVAVEGVLDLRSWDFRGSGPVPLIGDWDFFPGVFLSGAGALQPTRIGGRRIPDRWSGGMSDGRGAGTYRLRLLLPERPGGLGLRYTTVSTAFELDANGIRLAGAGRPSLDKRDEVSAYKPGTALLPEAVGSVVLVARVSNHDYRVGGMWRAFVLGEAGALERQRWSSVTGALALASSLAVLAVVFSFFIRKSEAGGGFACFCGLALATALRAVVTGDYAMVNLFPGLGFGALIRLEYLSIYSIFPLGFLFLRILFPEDADSRLSMALLALCAAFLLLVPFAPLRLLTLSILPYYALSAVVVAVAASAQIKAVARRRPGALPLLVGGIALAVTGINDALFSSFLVNTGNLVPYGMLLFIGAQAYALAGRYRGVQTQLRRALEEKDLLIKEVHHRVKNSLQIVSSIASLQAHRTDDSKALAAYASIRDRIRAVSLVHEKLYSLESGDMIDLSEYVRDLTTQLSESYGLEGDGVILEAESLSLPADLCIDIGLVLTELVSNAYKYALIPGKRGMIRVRLASESSVVVLSVADDGPGLPEGRQFEGATTLGFRLVSSLAKKWGASVELRRGQGAAFVIRFPAGRGKRES